MEEKYLACKVTLRMFFLVILVLLGKPVFAVLPHSTCTTLCSKPLENGRECVKVADQQLYIRKAGQGNPTVIFSSGTGLAADNWFESHIASEIAKKTTVLAYDRFHTFNSCQNANDFMPMTAANVVEELHQLLAILKLPPPYILVGHLSIQVQFYPIQLKLNKFPLYLENNNTKNQYSSHPV